MPILWHPLVATSFPNLFLQGNTVTAAANRLLETPPTDIHHQKHTADKCTDGDMVIFITTVQQTMTLKRAGLLSSCEQFIDWL